MEIQKRDSRGFRPINLWRELDFEEDEEWIQGQTPIGYGDGDDNTILDDMRAPTLNFQRPIRAFILEKNSLSRKEKFQPDYY